MDLRYLLEKYSIKLNIILSLMVLFWDLTQLKVINKTFGACFIIVYYLIAAASTYFIYKLPEEALIRLKLGKISFIFLILLMEKPAFAIQSILIYPVLLRYWKSKSTKAIRLTFYSIGLYLIGGVVLINLLLGSPFKEKEVQRVYSPDNKHYVSVVTKAGILDFGYSKIRIGNSNSKVFANEKTVYRGNDYSINSEVTWKKNDVIFTNLVGCPRYTQDINGRPFDWYRGFDIAYYIRYLLSEILLVLLIYYISFLKDKLSIRSETGRTYGLEASYYKY